MEFANVIKHPQKLPPVIGQRIYASYANYVDIWSTRARAH